MSRTMLAVITALALVAVSLSLMIARYEVMGSEARVPTGPGTWKVQMLVNGKSTGKEARLLTATPLDFGHQHVLRESCRSAEFQDKPPDARHPDRRQVIWHQRSGVEEHPCRATYEFYCTVDVHHPTGPMSELARTLYEPPQPGDELDAESRGGTDNEKITTLARQITVGLERPADQAEALFRYVDQKIANEPSFGLPVTSAAECLENERGDSGGKSRLLVALLRNRGIPARMVMGLTLSKGPEQVAHYWVEAWLHAHWIAMCPFYHHYGHVPPTYLVFGFGDQAMVRSRHIHDLDYAFLVERTAEETIAAQETSMVRRVLLACTFYGLPPAEQRLVEFLLLLPIAALIVCLYRNIIGLYSFGTFAPAVVGLAFRDLHSLPGLLVFITVVLIGWMMRRVLDYYHLLQVPRTAFLLTLVVIVLILVIVGGSSPIAPVTPTQYFSLFPMVILTGMIERFWTLETEDSTASSFRTLLATMLIAASIGAFLSIRAVADHMFRFPETLGLIMAIQLLLGRYTGYKLSELFRFRDFVQANPASTAL